MKGQAGKFSITCFAVRFPARLSGEALPSRKLVLPWGKSEAIDGAVTLDSSSVAVFSATQKLRGWDRVALDYEHNTVAGTPAHKESKEPREIAAFGVPELVPGEGLYLNSLEWTPDGPKAVPHFADLSPALVFIPGTRTVAGLHSVALCRAGAIAGLRAFSVDLPDANNANPGDIPMERTILLAMLGLPSTATDADMQKAAAEFGATLKSLSCDDVAAMSAELKKLTEKIETFSTTGAGHKDGIEALAKRLQKAEETIVTFTADRAAQERASIIDGALREGKVLPFSAEAMKTVPLDTLREVAKNTPSTVPLEQRTHAVETFAAGDRRAATGDPGTASAVAAKFGRKPEDLTKAGV